MKKGTAVRVRMPRGGEREGKFVGVHDTERGQWYEIKPPEKGAVTFRARPSMVTPVF